MMSKLLIAALAAAAAEPISRQAVVNKVNSLTSAVSDSATKLERHERASVTRERMAQWSNFIADVEEHIPELLQDTATATGKNAQMYEPLDFPAFVSAAPPTTTTTTTAAATWNPFEPWLVQLKAYRTYMANYIDYQITWVYKLKCTFTGDCDVKTTAYSAASGSTTLTLSSVAGIAKDDKLTITSATKASFLESSTTATCYTVKEVKGNTITLDKALDAEVKEGDAVTRSTACPGAAAASGTASFTASEIKLCPTAALTASTSLTIEGGTGATAATAANQQGPVADLTGCISTGTEAEAATSYVPVISFTPSVALPAGSVVTIAFGGIGATAAAGACTYTCTALTTTAPLVGIAADANFHTSGTAASNGAAFTATGISLTVKATAGIAKDTAVVLTLAAKGTDAAAALGTHFKTPATGANCAVNSDTIKIKAVDSAGAVLIAEAAVAKSPATKTA